MTSTANNPLIGVHVRVVPVADDQVRRDPMNASHKDASFYGPTQKADRVLWQIVDLDGKPVMAGLFITSHAAIDYAGRTRMVVVEGRWRI
jgi:hypothetical protein